MTVFGGIETVEEMEFSCAMMMRFHVQLVLGGWWVWSADGVPKTSHVLEHKQKAPA